MKRPYGRPLNPYSWMNRQVKSKRDVDGEMEMMPSEIKRDQILRNPYSWLARKQREVIYSFLFSRKLFFVFLYYLN